MYQEGWEAFAEGHPVKGKRIKPQRGEIKDKEPKIETKVMITENNGV